MGRREGGGRDRPYYPFWVSDYNGDPLVIAMTKLQDLAYRRMLDKSWELGPLPVEPWKVARLIRYSEEEFEEVWKYPLTECWVETEQGWVNRRLEKERAYIDGMVEQRRAAGRRSAESRRKRSKKKAKKRSGTGVQRETNERSTSVERDVNNPNPDEISLHRLNTIDPIDRDTNKEGRTGQRDAVPTARKAVQGRVKWVVDEKEGTQKLEASPKFRAEFLRLWKQHFSVEEIRDEVGKATRWLVPRPGRRGSRSRLDMYLHNWMEKALADKLNAEEAEEATTSTGRSREEPEVKWCRSCRGTLPNHMSWCREVKDGREGSGRTPAGDTGDGSKERPGV